MRSFVSCRQSTRHSVRHSALALAATFSLSLGGIVTAHAQGVIDTWSTTGAATAWLTATNWSTGAVPGATDFAQFGAAGTGTAIGINLNTPPGKTQQVGAIGFNNTDTRSRTIGNSSTSSNGTLQMNGYTASGITTLLSNASAANLTLFDGTAGTTMTVALTVVGNVDITSTGYIAVANLVTGVGGYNVTNSTATAGAGPFYLSNLNNTYSGGTTVSGGTLLVAGLGAIANALPVINGGTFGFGTVATTGVTGTISSNIALGAAGSGFASGVNSITTVSGVVSGTNGLTINGLGEVILSNAGNTYTGGTNIIGGSLLIPSFSALGSGGIAGVTLNGGQIGYSTGSGTLTQNYSLGAKGSGFAAGTGATTTVSGVISGSNGLTIGGTGVVVLSGTSNTYSGGTFLTGGALLVGSESNLSGGIAGITLNGGAFGFLSGNNTITQSFTLGGAGSGFDVVNAADVLTVSGVLSGTGGSLTKFGDGTLILTGTNTYTGGTTVTAGTLVLGSGSAIGTGPIVLTGTGGLSLQGNSITLASNLAGTGGTINNASNTPATLTVTQTSASTYSGTLTDGPVASGTPGALSLVKQGSGTLTLTGNNTFTGGTTITAGTLLVNSLNAVGGTVPTINGGTFGFGSGTTTGVAGTISTGVALGAAGSGFAAGTASTTTVSGVVSGSNGLVVNGAGSVILTNDANSYASTTTIRGGTLLVSDLGVLGTGGIAGVTINGGLFGFASGNNTLAQNFALGAAGSGFAANATSDVLTVSGIISGTNGLTTGGLGTVLLANSADTYTGTTTISSGTLQIGNNDASGYLPATGTIAIGSATSPVATLLFNRTDTVTFTNAITDNGGQTGNGGAVNNGGVVNVGSGTVALTGTITGSGSVTQSGTGTLVLSGTGNVYTAGTFINQGTVQVSVDRNLGFFPSVAQTNITFGGTGNGVLQFASAGALNAARGIQLSAGGTIDTVANAITYGGIITGSGGLKKVGTGNLTLSGLSTYTGGTAVNAGTLIVGGGATTSTTATATGAGTTTVNNGGTLSVVTTGGGTVKAVDLKTGGTVEPSVAAASGGTLTVSSSLTLDGGSFGNTVSGFGWELGSDLIDASNGSLINAFASPTVFNFTADGTNGTSYVLIDYNAKSGFPSGNANNYFSATGQNGTFQFGTDPTKSGVFALIFNLGATAGMPEPGTLPLLLLGAAGSIGIATRRRFPRH